MASTTDPSGFTLALGEFFTATGQPRMAASCYAAAMSGRRNPGRLRFALAEALMRSGCTSPSTLDAVDGAVPNDESGWEYWALWVGSALTLRDRSGDLPLRGCRRPWSRNHLLCPTRIRDSQLAAQQFGEEGVAEGG